MTNSVMCQCNMFKERDSVRKQISLIGSTRGSHQDFRDVLALLWQRKLRPVIDRIMPLSEGEDAYAAVERGEQFGKIVLTP